ncbi:MAG: helix-turn-helix domain-containing protein [Planctomycetota bacterium]|nr:helix-turn-helix domain-containing protein [Planctomycetota bacterium]
MATYVSLDEAAKLLNMTPETLVELRSRGEIFGFRDGSSWKFKADEIERVLQERSGDVLDEDAGGSSILLSERSGLSGLSGKIGAGLSGTNSGKSDLSLEPSEEDSEALQLGSDVTLVPDPSSGSGVRLVNRASQTPPLRGFAEDDDELLGLSDDDSGEMEIDASSQSLGPGSDLELSVEPTGSSSGSKKQSPSRDDSDVLAGSDLRLQTSDIGGTPDLVRSDDSDSAIELDGGLEFSNQDDDLVLGSSSDLGLSADSGINLMSPSDSGLSLEDEPLDLAGTGISGLDLGSEGSGSDVGGSDPKSGVGSGISGIDFAAAEDFQLSPSGGIEIEEDSGSQVIEIEDSTEMGDPLTGARSSDPFGDSEDAGEGGSYTEGDGDAFGVPTGGVVGAAAGAYRGLPEVPLAGWQVATLLCIVIFMGMSGILITDIVRNMWSWNGESNISVSSWFTKMIVDSLGMQG